MSSGLDIQNLKRKLNKKPKSLLFARLADELRKASLGEEEKLEYALNIADRGLEANPDFLQGRLVRSRILLEKGDLTGAKMDLEFVAEKDPFCLSAQKLLLETLAKLGESPQTETYQKILSCLEPDVVINPKVLESLEKAAANSKATTSTKAIVKTKKSKASDNDQKETVFATLDSILEEDVGQEAELKNSIFKTFDNIFEAKPPENKEPENKAPVSKVSENKVPEKIPEIEEPAPTLQPDASEPELMPYIPPSGSSPTIEEGTTKFEQISGLDDILNEQLASKIDAGDLPDLTGDITALLSTEAHFADAPPADAPLALEHTSLASQNLAPKDDAPLALEHTSLASPSFAINVDDILAEQLAPKLDDAELPNLMDDINTLLSESSAPEIHSAPNLDDILKEQLASKVKDEELPDLLGDMSELLASDPDAHSAPNLDDILKEQLASKVKDEELPDLLGDMSALLASDPDAHSAPSLDDILKEQLASKVKDEELPNLLGDMSALLASDPDAHSAPSLDDILKEQLASKVKDEELPNLLGDMSALLEPTSLASQKADTAKLPDLMDDMNVLIDSTPLKEAAEPEIELMPYIPPSKSKPESGSSAPDIDSLIKEQLAPKIDIEDLPDLMGDMLDLLEPKKETKEDAFAQNPTPTLAELYLSQGLTQKAVDVYKELLARDPSNAELKTKLAQAKARVNT
jgi:hypothetical protein